MNVHEEASLCGFYVFYDAMTTTTTGNDNTGDDNVGDDDVGNDDAGNDGDAKRRRHVLGAAL